MILKLLNPTHAKWPIKALLHMEKSFAQLRQITSKMFFRDSYRRILMGSTIRKRKMYEELLAKVSILGMNRIKYTF